MAVPSADFILAMLNPYKGFDTARSAQMGIAAGSAAAETRDRRKSLAQQKELAQADDARAGQYLDLQKQQAAFGQKQDLNDRRMKAYAGFQAAVDAGDTEGADLAANQLRMLGVDVQQYGGSQEGGPAAPAKPPPLTQESPTAAVAQAQAQGAGSQTPAPPPMSKRDAQTSRELDDLARSATVDSGDPMGAMGPAPVVRPRAARGGLQGVSAPIDLLTDPMSRVVPIPNARVDNRPLREQLTPIPVHTGPQIDLAQEISNLGHGRRSALNAEPGPDGPPVEQLGDPLEGKALTDAASRELMKRSPAVDPLGNQSEIDALMAAANETLDAPDGRGPRPGPAREQYIKGDEPAPAGEATPNQGLTRGYRLSFDDGTGRRQTIDIDPQSIQERQRQRVANSLRPLLDNARTPEEEIAAKTAIEAAVASVGTFKPSEAIQYGIKLYQDPLDRGAKEKRARIVSGKGGGDGYGGVGELTESKKKRLGELNDDIRTYVQGFETKFDITNVRKGLDSGKKVAELLASGSSVAQRGALTATLKSWFGAASSNKELQFMLESSGKWAQLENGYNAWVNGGQLSEDFIRNLKSAIVDTNDFYRRKLHDTGEQAAQGLLNDFTFTGRMTREEAQAAADNIRGRFTGVYKTEKKKEGGPLVRGSKAKPKAAPPAKGSAAERAKRYGY